MPYRVVLDRKDGKTRVEVSKICSGTTPGQNSEVTTEIDGIPIRAIVMSVSWRHRQSSTAGEAIDYVYAKEL